MKFRIMENWNKIKINYILYTEIEEQMKGNALFGSLKWLKVKSSFMSCNLGAGSQ